MPARPAEPLDPRSPLVLDTRELGRRAGAMREVQRSFPAPEGWGLELVSVPSGSLVRLDARLESVMDGVLLTATVTAPIEAECGRCLDPVRDTVTADVQELYAYEPDPEAGDEDGLVLDGDLIDLTAVVRDAILLSLPLNPVCDPDCRGLCAECGARLAEVGAEHSHTRPDPRWAALADLVGPASEHAEADPSHTGENKRDGD